MNTFVEPLQLERHCAVVDAGNSTLVALAPEIPTVVHLRDSLMDTHYFVDIESPDLVEIKAAGPRMYPEWSWDPRNRVFTRTNPAIITEQMRERAVLAAKKGEIISRATYLINRSRDKLNTGFLFQPSIYGKKQRQARILKTSGFDLKRAGSIHYVVQYAEESGMSLREAAEDILFQAQLCDEHLLKTEKVRLSLFGKIKRARTPEELDDIMERLQREVV